LLLLPVSLFFGAFNKHRPCVAVQRTCCLYLFGASPKLMFCVYHLQDPDGGELMGMLLVCWNLTLSVGLLSILPWICHHRFAAPCCIASSHIFNHA
jgi:hypothetical protein